MLKLTRTDAPPGELRGRFDVVRAIPFDQVALAYAICVPKAFDAARDLAPSEVAPLGRLVIGRFTDPHGASIEVSVYGTRREVGLPDLLLLAREEEGIALESAELCAYGTHEGVDARCHVAATGEAVRLVLVRQGDSIARVTCRAAAHRMDALSPGFAVALSTFRFKAPGERPLIEPFSYLASVGALPLGFRVSEAWRAREVESLPYGRQALEAALVDGGEIVVAQRAEAIDPDSFGEASLERLSGEAVRGLAALGFQPGALKQRFRAALPGIPARPSERGEVHAGFAFGRAAEARIALRLGPGAHHWVAVFAAAREVDRWGWMVARRALEIAFLSLGDENASFAVPEDTIRALRRIPTIQPVYRPDGKLDEKTFDGFDLADERDDPAAAALEDGRVQVVERSAFEELLRRQMGAR